MKTFADLKRYLQIGTKVRLIFRFGKPVEVLQNRTVSKIQTNAVCFKVDGTAKESWLAFPKASLLEITDQGFKIYAPGKRELTEQEKQIITGYEQVRNYKQEEIDALSDGSTSYYQRLDYFRKHNVEYLMGKMERGMKYNFDNTVTDEKIKGNLELEYQI